MIKFVNNYFVIETENLSYIFHTNKMGILVQDYFGNKIPLTDDLSSLGTKEFFAKGTQTILDPEVDSQFCLDNVLTEYSSTQKGDYKEPAIVIRNEQRGYTFDFRYDSYEIRKPQIVEELPMPHDLAEELVVKLKEVELNICIELHYFINEKYDVIVRNVVLKNNTSEELIINKIASLQLDLINKEYEVMNLNGCWAGETHTEFQKIHKGIYINDSKTGNSSNRHNPFFLIKEEKATVDYGEVYSFNLIYSGNHQELVELSTFDHLRVQTGINPHLFNWVLKGNESFVTPFALMSYSNKGTNDASQKMHDFINNCVVNKNFRGSPRPVLINNWEGTYFKFKETKLLHIAKNASKFGVELFVLDDGWFSNRNDDQHGLGDYDVNRKKVRHDLSGLAKRINKLGMKFGLWFEPESCNLDSKLYKAHPDYVVSVRGIKPSMGRNQMILDLSKTEVQDYIIRNVSEKLNNANIEYVKWDMNRNISDICFNDYDPGEFYHRYMLGLYRIIRTLTSKFPHVLFENCASGGNRFDLGMLSYFPQSWASDDTDPYERISVQTGLSYGYPLSTICAHVSHKINHQTLRNTNYNTKFDVACFGVLGYELSLDELSKLEKVEIKRQIEFYKKYRELFQFGDFYRLKDKEYNGDNASWMVQNKEHTEAIISTYNGVASVNQQETLLKGYNFIKDKKYIIEVFNNPLNISTFGNLINMVLPIHVNCDGFIARVVSRHKTMNAEKESYLVSGEQLNNGIPLLSEWSGNGYNEKTRILLDYGARLYHIKAID